jgi:hypothetical protein
MNLLESILTAIHAQAAFLEPRAKAVGKIGKTPLYNIHCNLEVKFHVGENLNFFRGNTFVDTLLQAQQKNPDQIEQFIRRCVHSLDQPLLPAPKVYDTAKRYLGKEENWHKNAEETQTVIVYPFYVVYVTGSQISLAMRNSGRLVFAARYHDELSLEQAFSKLSDVARDIKHYSKSFE